MCVLKCAVLYVAGELAQCNRPPVGATQRRIAGELAQCARPPESANQRRPRCDWFPLDYSKRLKFGYIKPIFCKPASESAIALDMVELVVG